MIEALLSIAALALLGLHLATVGLYLWRVQFPPAARGMIGQPAITLLRPVCGLDAFDAETLGSSFTQDYPDYEIIFCAPSAGDAAVPLVQRLMDAHPERRAQLLVGQVALTGNPKLNNLWKGWDAAAHDWVCMTDSNLLLPPDYLSTLVAAWGLDTGLVSSPPIGMRPDGFGGHLECAFLNSNQARWQFAAASLGNAFAQGKTLFWNKPMVDGAGGLAVLGRHLAEDVSSTKLVRSLGLHVSLPPRPFAQPIGWRSLRQVWDRQLRWSRVRRDGFPFLFAGEITNGAAVGALLMAFAVGPLAMVAYLALWWGAEVVLMQRAGWPHGWRDVVVLPLRDALLPALWAATFLRRGFEWRGTAMTTVEEPAT
jgi:ceramide glucosyltransferase